jgi:hypothetical protein
MRRTILGFAAALAFAGLLYAQEAKPTTAVTGADELVKKKGLYQETWVRPDADMARYSKLYLWQPEFQFREGGATSAGTTTQMMRGDGGPYAVRPEDQERFKQLVTETFVAEIERSKLFEVVDRPGPETLIVLAGFLDIVSDVPPNPTRAGNIYLAAVGEATLVFALVDAETGVIQARAAERREIQPDSRMRGVNAAPANSATVWMDVERWARDRAQDLRKALEKAKKKAEK